MDAFCEIMKYNDGFKNCLNRGKKWIFLNNKYDRRSQGTLESITWIGSVQDSSAYFWYVPGIFRIKMHFQSWEKSKEADMM